MDSASFLFFAKRGAANPFSVPRPPVYLSVTLKLEPLSEKETYDETKKDQRPHQEPGRHISLIYLAFAFVSLVRADVT